MENIMRTRNNRVTFRLNDAEHVKFMNAVARSGISQQAFLRHIINGYAPKEKPPPDYFAMMTELRRVGININQIARAVNTYGFADPKAYYENAKLCRETLLKITKAVIEPEKI
jgi:hypothetical protein